MLLPGRRTLLFSLYQGATSRLAAMDLRTGVITRFDQPGFAPQWVNGGFVVLGNPDGTLDRPAVRCRAGAADRPSSDDRPRRLAAERLFPTGRCLSQRIDRLPAGKWGCAAATDAGVALGTRHPAHARPEAVREPALLP